ncbi:MAG: hypothetical protein SWY16_02845 [Cyanobacteriota bacterium]|nr:hypothetical protein [Cyanobacteriota bacterium]
MTDSRILIHIGYPKAASTWLQQVIFKDENSGFYAPWGLPSYEALDSFINISPYHFSADSVRQTFNLGLKNAAEKQLVPVISEEFLTGDQTRGKYWGKEVAERLHAVFPEGRVLILIREQKSIILSAYRQYIRRGGFVSLERFLGISTQNKTGIGPVCRLDYFEYDRPIEHYQTLFGSENVLVLPTEFLKKNAKDAIEKILSFSGSQGNPDYQKVAQNVGIKGGTLAFRQKLNNFCAPPEQQESVQGFIWLLGYKMSGTIEKFLPQKYHDRAEENFKNIIAQIAGDSFIQSNQRTSQLIGMNLKDFGYSC